MLSHPYILFLDTEISDKPRHWNSKETEEWPFIVQAAWSVCDRHGKEILFHDVIVRADDYTIAEEARNIHGITEESTRQKGVSRKEALRMLVRDLKRYKPLIVGHFVDLDIRMVEMASKRAGMKNFILDYPVFCTMKATSDYIHLPNRHYPQLAEIYQMLFKRKMENVHHALADVRATSEVFFELVRRGEVNDDVIRHQHRQKKHVARKKTGCGLPVFIILSLLLWMFR